MEKNKVVFLCELPPPFGGVTVKNNLLLNAVLAHENVEIVDFFECKRSPINIPAVFLKMIRAFSCKYRIVYGFGSYKRLYIALSLQRILGGQASLNKTINVVMGGTLQDEIKGKPVFQKLLKKVNVNYVETAGMMNELAKYEIKNTALFPNARSCMSSIVPQNRNADIIRCVFFSQIGVPKGAPVVFDMLERIPKSYQDKISIDFYGVVVDSYKLEFESMLRKYSNVRYHGVFDAVNENVYQKLNEYDVLLFPTSHVGEGVSGVLVEAKMAGICPIVTDHCYNSEVVLHGKEGIVIENADAQLFAEELIHLVENRDELTLLKMGAYESRMRYAMESYTHIFKLALGQLA